MPQRLLPSYTADATRYDEMLAADGHVRPHWRALIDQLENLPPEMLRHRDYALRDAIASDSVGHNAHADAQGFHRPWELDFLPQIIAADEWRKLSVAVTQRACLFNALLDDLYGKQSLLAEGLLPPALVFGQSAYLWPCRDVRMPGGVHLHLYAVDLARSADGNWWVVADHTQAPSGAGHALRQRQIMTSAWPEALRDMPVQTLLHYFHTLQRCLTRLAPTNGEAPLVVLLTPGPYHETYSEHVFLARTLGFPLVVGADLTVRADMVYWKTSTGLRRVHAILRGLDDDACDPLELRADSALGIAGLTQVARCGKVLIANALGSGVLQSRALYGFLPAMCRRLLGEELALPMVASWWCGENPALEYTLAHLQELVIMPVCPSMPMPAVFAQTPDAQARRGLAESLRFQPHAYVAQEWVRLSQAPVLSCHGDNGDNGDDGEYGLMNRTISLRLFAVADGDGGYHVMPGGLARVASRQHCDVVPMQSGGLSKDVWVLGETAADVVNVVDTVAASAPDSQT